MEGWQRVSGTSVEGWVDAACLFCFNTCPSRSCSPLSLPPLPSSRSPAPGLLQQLRDTLKACPSHPPCSQLVGWASESMSRIRSLSIPNPCMAPVLVGKLMPNIDAQLSPLCSACELHFQLLPLSPACFSSLLATTTSSFLFFNLLTIHCIFHFLRF